MIRIAYLTAGLLLFSNRTVNAQSVEALEEKKGFRDIVLDSPVRENENLSFKKIVPIEDSELPLELYLPQKGAYLRIGDIPIRHLSVLAYKGKIIRIILETPNDPAVMKALKTLYGEPYYSIRSALWEWQSEHVFLSFAAEGKRRVRIIYRSKNLHDYMENVKEEKIDRISNEF